MEASGGTRSRAFRATLAGVETLLAVPFLGTGETARWRRRGTAAAAAGGGVGRMCSSRRRSYS